RARRRAHACRWRQKAETGLRQALEERERLLEDRRQAVAARDQFLAVAAHELRTPLATLAMLVDYLIMPMLPHSKTEPGGVVVQMRQLAMVKRQVDRLAGLGGGMLGVPRNPRGRFRL